MPLIDELYTAIREPRDIAPNGYLALIARYVVDIERSAATNPLLADYCAKMRELVLSTNFALNGELVSKFTQIFGEAHTLSLFQDRNVTLKKVPERPNKKTPDFSTTLNNQDVFFEVKTLSVVGDGRGLNSDSESALDAAISIEKQMKAGEKVATGVSLMQPYRDKPYKLGQITGVIDTLIEKTRQNIKNDQYLNPNTFLVLNLVLLPPVPTSNLSLRPAYFDDSVLPTVVTGSLWMLAFASPGVLIQGIPEFAGQACIEGKLDKLGILADNAYAAIAGMIFIVYSLSGKPEIFGLYRAKDRESWIDGNHDLVLELLKLTGKVNWNDDLDSNGWQLLGKQAEASKSMTNEEAGEVAILLNRRNRLTQQYTQQMVLKSANEYVIKSIGGHVIAAVQLKAVQWYQVELCHLTVDETHEGKGHARELVALAEARALELRARVIQCTIRDGNTDSERLFRSAGYTRVSNFYNESSRNQVAIWQKPLVTGPKVRYPGSMASP